MSDEVKDKKKLAKPAKAAFSMRDKLRALEGVIGHQRPAKCFVQNVQAQYLHMDSGQWSRKLDKASVAGSEAAALIEWFDLGALQLDYRLFEAEDRDSFLGILQRHRAGTYGGSFRGILCGRLRDAAARHPDQAGQVRSAKCAVKITRFSGEAHRGGIGRDPDPRQVLLMPIQLNKGDRVRFDLAGPNRRHIVLLTASYGAAIDVLSPTMQDPQQFSHGSAVSFPDGNADLFSVREPGQHYIFALWTDADTAAGFAQAARNNGNSLTDADAGQILRRLEAAGVVADVAMLNYEVLDNVRF